MLKISMWNWHFPRFTAKLTSLETFHKCFENNPLKLALIAFTLEPFEVTRRPTFLDLLKWNFGLRCEAFHEVDIQSAKLFDEDKKLKDSRQYFILLARYERRYSAQLQKEKENVQGDEGHEKNRSCYDARPAFFIAVWAEICAAANPYIGQEKVEMGKLFYVNHKRWDSLMVRYPIFITLAKAGIEDFPIHTFLTYTTHDSILEITVMHSHTGSHWSVKKK